MMVYRICEKRGNVMKKMSLVLFILFFGLSGCQANPISSVQTFQPRQEIQFTEMAIPRYFIPKTITVVGLGDSLTQGVGDERKQDGYLGRISEKMKDWKGVLAVEVDNRAKRGKRSDQLLQDLSKPEIQAIIKKADVIYMTIGGNDLMKIVKEHLFKLQKKPFELEKVNFQNRLAEIFDILRVLNPNALIVLPGLYNPFSIITDEAKEFEDIIEEWNKVLELQAMWDGKTCYVMVSDLFDSNANMVYHTDFFHPNGKGYVGMADRIEEQLKQCNLYDLSEGQLDF